MIATSTEGPERLTGGMATGGAETALSTTSAGGKDAGGVKKEHQEGGDRGPAGLEQWLSCM